MWGASGTNDSHIRSINPKNVKVDAIDKRVKIVQTLLKVSQ